MSRAEKIASDLQDSVSEESERIESATADMAEGIVKGDDEKMWAAYRLLDVTQAEAADMMCNWVTPSQSTASRRMSAMDSEILLDGVEKHTVRNHEDDLEHIPEVMKEAYRDVAARFILDVAALSQCGNDAPTPEWAQQRFPDMPEDIGYEIIESMGNGDY